MRPRLVASILLLMAGALAPAALPQTLGIFAGRYRLTLTFGPSCQAQVRTVSISMVLSEAAVAGATEIDARPLLADEVESTQLVLLRQRSALHGPFSTWGGRTDRWPVTTTGGLYLMPWVILDGTVSVGPGRPRAQGTAFGVLQLGRPEDEVPNTLGFCSATDHGWALDPE